MTARARVPLIDDDDQELTSDLVYLAASSAEPIAERRGAVHVDELYYDSVSLVASALGVQRRKLNERSAMAALMRLGFELSEVEPYEPALHANTPTADEPADDWSSLLAEIDDPLQRLLQRFRGKWVALDNNVVIAHADTLRQLLGSLDGRDAAVVHVPSARKQPD